MSCRWVTAFVCDWHPAVVRCHHHVISWVKWHADTLHDVQINRDGEPMRAAHFNFKVLKWLLR